MDILGRDVLKIYLVDSGTGVHVQTHTGRSYDKIYFETGIISQFRGIVGLTGKTSVRSVGSSYGIGLCSLLYRFEKTAAPAQSQSL